MVLRETLGIASVVEHVRPLQLDYDLLNKAGFDPLALQIRLQLGNRAVADRKGPAGQVEGPAELLVRRRQAACSSGVSASSLAGVGISATVPCAMPTAS